MSNLTLEPVAVKAPEPQQTLRRDAKREAVVAAALAIHQRGERVSQSAVRAATGIGLRTIQSRWSTVRLALAEAAPPVLSTVETNEDLQQRAAAEMGRPRTSYATAARRMRIRVAELLVHLDAAKAALEQRSEPIQQQVWQMVHGCGVPMPIVARRLCISSYEVGERLSAEKRRLAVLEKQALRCRWSQSDVAA